MRYQDRNLYYFIQELKNNMYEFGYIVGSCFILLESTPMFQVKHVHRDVLVLNISFLLV